jgi:hypothetical protein
MESARATRSDLLRYVFEFLLGEIATKLRDVEQSDLPEQQIDTLIRAILSVFDKHQRKPSARRVSNTCVLARRPPYIDAYAYSILIQANPVRRISESGTQLPGHT